ncbi:MarR family transcriptional regulator [Mycolicibacterium sp. YH-1]|uniref:MarR family transcriptional regulator n=1 Tax=Mycolicibacterium sp. YH-1 TaxID=2908837 RepID=UPI001F4C1FC1|nr:MarR family transcriptional regulator [Mycolicibacterium sp. YH-1]UNB54755.1 MarR family transcriptional regulator [Mycolicibacterium sp. YH-1]
MDRQRMHRLGRRLVKLSRQVHLEPQDVTPSPAEELILGDVMLYPGSAVADVVKRTGFTQGYVSKCVAALTDQGLLTTGVDPADRRRIVIEPSVMLVSATRRRTPPLTDVLSDALGGEASATEVMAMLDELAELLLR